ncbi:MAG: sigma-70 family RNA polymerase sigma factor [Clostridia bacterium]|nr:sigma-70 family RNA polymerase sigma factor [Clostridia bacterium]
MAEATAMTEKLITEFSENYMEKLFYFCLKRTGNSNEAEDLTQDIALSILTALNKGIIPASFSAWVWQIARNRYSVWADTKHKKAESVTDTDIGDYDIEDDSESALEKMVREEQLSLLRRELAFIGREYRNVVVAYYIEDKSVREIADSLSLSEAAVKQKLYRARIVLKEGMDMAKEFGVRSYKPEEIIYANVCDRPGELGQPWTLMDPKLNQNIFLACYANPSTADELAIEMGVALPYMEDVLEHLVYETVLSKTDSKYETAFPIISREAQEKLHCFYSDVLSRLMPILEENIDRLMEQFQEAGANYYGKWLSYDEAKWVLLMHHYKELYDLCKASPKTTFGHTERNNHGKWDVIALESYEKTPKGVGFHCQTNGFVHYRYGYKNIWNQTPSSLSEAETSVLRRLADGKHNEENDIAAKLEKYDYIRKCNGKYVPHIAVFDSRETKKFLKFCDKKTFSNQFIEHAEARKKLTDAISEILAEINHKVCDILYHDLPKSIHAQKYMMDALVREICRGSYTLGYIIEQAVSDGWLKYDETTSTAIGAYIDIR